MAISSRLLHRLRQLIADAHSAFVVNYISPGAVPPDVLERLRRLGMVVKPRQQVVDQAYLLGRLIAAKQAEQDRAAAAAKVAEDARLRAQGRTTPRLRVGAKPGPGSSTPVLKTAESKQVSLAQLEEVLRRDPVPLTAVERRAMDVDAVKTGQYIVGLGNRVEQKTGQMLIEVDRKLDLAYRTTVKDAVARNIERRETVGKLRSDLGHSVGDWSRDLARISTTEKQNALQEGYAAEVINTHGAEAGCFKVVSPLACDSCKRLYLLPDGNPRVFTIAELQANGSNFGKKQKDWLAVLGPAHPSCLCSLSRLPVGATPMANGRFSYKSLESAKGPSALRLTLKKSHLNLTRRGLRMEY